MSARITTARSRRARRRTALAAAAGLAVLAGLIGLGATAQRGLPWRSYYTVSARFRDAKNIARFADVRVAGRRVGQVTAVDYDSGSARVRLQLDASVRPLRSETTARIRLKGGLGSKYVELVPGRRGRPIPDAGTIPVARTSSTVELTDVVASFDRRRRAELGDTIRGLGAGFLGRGEQLNGSLRALPNVLRDADSVARAVNATGPSPARFFPALEHMTAAFEPVREEIARSFAPGARALRPFTDERRATQRLLELAPAALATTRTGLTEANPLLDETARLARATTRLGRWAPAGLRASARLLRASPPALRRTRTLLRLSAAAVPPTLDFTRRIDPLVTPFTASLRTPRPGLVQLARYGCDLLGMGRNWRSMMGFGLPSDNPIGRANVLRLVLAMQATSQADVPLAPGSQSRYRKPCELGAVTP
jgi:virulence factor Mce-like protein